MRISIRAAALGLAVPILVMASLAGCSPVVALTAADDAKNTACAEVVVRLPDLVAGLSKRKTDAQGTGAWGEPTAVFLRCGVPVPDPTSTLTCYTIEGVDWLVDPQEESTEEESTDEDPVFVFTTYGRDPAVEVVVNSGLASGRAALTDVAGAVRVIPADRACVAPEDTLAG